MKPNPTNVQAIQDLPTPKNQGILQSSLEVIHYLQTFIPSLSSKTNFFWDQLSAWDWNPSTVAALQHLKA